MGLPMGNGRIRESPFINVICLKAFFRLFRIQCVCPFSETVAAVYQHILDFALEVKPALLVPRATS